MKRIAFRIIALTICMCAALAAFVPGALAMSAPGGAVMNRVSMNVDGSILTFSLESDNEATLVSVQTDKEALNIDIGIKHNGQEYIVTEIAQNAFDGCHSLKYVLMSADNWNRVTGREYDFSSAENLKVVFVNADRIYIIDNRDVKFVFAPGSSADLQRYLDMTEKTIKISRPAEYQDGSVTLSFDDKCSSGCGCEYRIKREELGSGKPPVEFIWKYDDVYNDDDTAFVSMSGLVRFTDGTVEPGKTYQYTVTAWEPMGSISQPGYAEITIPAPPAPVPPAFEPAVPMPETGDGADIALWMGMLAVAAIGILSLSRKARKEY